jgi:hypothetical protein
VAIEGHNERFILVRVWKDFCEPDAKVAKFDTEDSLDNSSSNQTTSLEQSPSNHLRTAVGGNSCFSMSKKYKVFQSMSH